MNGLRHSYSDLEGDDDIASHGLSRAQIAAIKAKEAGGGGAGKARPKGAPTPKKPATGVPKPAAGAPKAKAPSVTPPKPKVDRAKDDILTKVSGEKAPKLKAPNVKKFGDTKGGGTDHHDPRGLFGHDKPEAHAPKGAKAGKDHAPHAPESKHSPGAKHGPGAKGHVKGKGGAHAGKKGHSPFEAAMHKAEKASSSLSEIKDRVKETAAAVAKGSAAGGGVEPATESVEKQLKGKHKFGKPEGLTHDDLNVFPHTYR